MAENSKIEWTHHTFNPWVGCTKVSPACDHCYAEGWAKRSGMVQWGPHAERRRTSESNWRQPIKWNAEAERLGVRYRVFCSSLADVFDNAVPVQWRIGLMKLICETPHLDWLLLTKRIGNASAMLETSFRAVHHQRDAWREMAAMFGKESPVEIGAFISELQNRITTLDAKAAIPDAPFVQQKKPATPRRPFTVTGLTGYHAQNGRVTLFVDRRLSARSITFPADRLNQLAEMARGA